jgi:hypothetical protein
MAPTSEPLCSLDKPLRSRLKLWLLAFLFTASVYSPLLAQPVPPGRTSETKTRAGLTRTKLAGLFKIGMYGFSVTIRPEVISYGPSCDPDGICGPSHGFTGTLANDKHSEVYLFAEYAPWLGRPPRLVRSNDEAFDYVLGGSRSPGTKLSVVSRVDATLDSLPAVHVISTIRTLDQPEVTEDIIYAIRPVSKDESLLYHLGLRVPSADYQRSKAAFVSLVKSFKITAITD